MSGAFDLKEPIIKTAKNNNSFFGTLKFNFALFRSTIEMQKRKKNGATLINRLSPRKFIWEYIIAYINEYRL